MSEHVKFTRVAYEVATRVDDGQDVRRVLRELLLTDENIQRFLEWCVSNGYGVIWDWYYD